MTQISFNPPPTEERDRALGRYMDAWSRLEASIRWTTQEILGVEPGAAYVIWSAIQTYQAIELFGAAAKMHFTEAGVARVARICERLKRRNTLRNHIVHGTWIIRGRVDFLSGETTTSGWIRTYEHINPDLSELPHDDPKRAGIFSFTVPELDKTTAHVEEMVDVLDALEDDIASLRARPLNPPG